MVSNLVDLGINPTTGSGGSPTNAPGLNLAFNIGPNGFFDKPANWTSQRESPGAIQQAISGLVAAQNKLRKAVIFETYDKQALDKAFLAFQALMKFETSNNTLASQDAELQKAINNINEGYAVASKTIAGVVQGLTDFQTTITASVPDTFIFGLADGG